MTMMNQCASQFWFELGVKGTFRIEILKTGRWESKEDKKICRWAEQDNQKLNKLGKFAKWNHIINIIHSKNLWPINFINASINSCSLTLHPRLSPVEPHTRVTIWLYNILIRIDYTMVATSNSSQTPNRYL